MSYREAIEKAIQELEKDLLESRTQLLEKNIIASKRKVELQKFKKDFTKTHARTITETLEALSRYYSEEDDRSSREVDSSPQDDEKRVEVLGDLARAIPLVSQYDQVMTIFDLITEDAGDAEHINKEILELEVEEEEMENKLEELQEELRNL
jgi:hypothetical protein